MTEKHGKTLPSPSCDFFTALKKSSKKFIFYSLGNMLYKRCIYRDFYETLFF